MLKKINNLSNAKVKATLLVCNKLNIKKNEIKKITFQKQGWTNKVFLFELKNHKKYIVRIASFDKLLDRNNEITVLKLLLENNNSWGFIYIDKKNGDFIRKYIEGKTAHIYVAKNNTFLKLLANKLKQLHSIKISKNYQIKENDDHQYDKYNKYIDQKYQKMFDNVLEKNKYLNKCLCHHDLTPWNIIYNKKNRFLALIDFEWSRINTPYFDLANFIRETNIHNTKYEKIFLNAYDKKINPLIIIDYLYITSYFSYLWTYSIKTYKHILTYRARMLKLIKKIYQEIIQQNK